MKIAILSAVNIRHMSLISLYTDILKKNHVDYDIIYMDKYNEEEAFDCKTRYRYVNVIGRRWPRFFKKIKYMLFVPYAERILKKNKYDFVIVWNDVAIFMFADFLRRHYAGKYCMNVRDNMYYDKPFWNRRYGRSFQKAAFVTISSRGYLDILPKGIDYVQIQSLNLSVLDGMRKHDGLRSEGEPIRIGFIGYVRYFERNQKLLDAFANDDRFELHYYGTKANVLQAYAQEHGIRNTAFHDTFPVADTGKYLEKIDLVNNLYGNGTVNVRRAISIKLFHAIYSRVPILVCPNTYVGEVAKSLGMGFDVDDSEIDAALPDRLYAWYRSLDFDAMQAKGAAYMESAIRENEAFAALVERYLNGNQQ